MKAIFMTNVGGKLLEIDRLEIKPTDVYYCAVREPIQMRAISETETTQTTLAVKKERWRAHSRPINFSDKEDFAVFLFDGME